MGAQPPDLPQPAQDPEYARLRARAVWGASYDAEDDGVWKADRGDECGGEDGGGGEVGGVRRG